MAQARRARDATRCRMDAGDGACDGCGMSNTSIREMQAQTSAWAAACGWGSVLIENVGLAAQRLECLVEERRLPADSRVIISQEEANAIAAKLALVMSEAAEALEELRIGRIRTAVIDGKPEGLANELADVVIRVFNLAAMLGIDMQSEIEDKMAYNRSREFRHGGKAL